MALGGGNFIRPNKVLPGTYMNFVSAAKVSSRDSLFGIVALPLSLDWGQSGVIALTKEDFYDKSFELFGYEIYAPEMLPLRELFKHAIKAYIVRINAGQAAAKASNALATAKYVGTRGNAITIKVSAEVDASTFKVVTLVGTKTVDTQTGIATMADLKDNDWVAFNTAATLAANDGSALIGGTNASATVESWTSALGLLESKQFNILAIDSADSDVLSLAIAYTKRMRDEVGNKFQMIAYKTDTSSDYEGVIDLVSKADDGTSLVYWAAGLLSASALNSSCTNAKYDGEKVVSTSPTSTELETYLKTGKLALHTVGDDIRVLEDINSLVTYTDDKSDDFATNQTVRILDYYSKTIAALFAGKYLGSIPNDKSGRVSLWNDIVNIKNELLTIRAIDAFDTADIAVEEGPTKSAVVVNDNIKPINAMNQLYVTVVVQ